jgi:DNA topoisomerase-1
MWPEMHLKMGRFGKYMACTNEECKRHVRFYVTAKRHHRKKIRCHYLSCRKRTDAYFVLRDGAAGVFLAANTFPEIA